MNKTTKRIISLLCVALLAVSLAVFAVGCANKSGEADNLDTQYVLFLGTNDKDTVEPVFTPEVCKEKLIEILLKHFGGYTITEAEGGWKDGDKVFTEYTLVVYLSDTTLEKVHAACDEMIKTFNQTSVLIQANKTKTEFYSGAKK